MPIVFDRLREFWWCRTDENCLDIPLAEVNQLNMLGEQPIHIAAWKGEVDDILYLISNGADINAIGDLGMTPLHYAHMGGKHENVRALLNAGANPNIRCEYGFLPHEVSKLND